MILCIICTTTIFGLGETTLSQVINTVPEDIWGVIDEFSGESGGKNDFFTKKLVM